MKNARSTYKDKTQRRDTCKKRREGKQGKRSFLCYALLAYLGGEKERYAGIPPRTLHRCQIDSSP
jgi:hypothetical protein